MECRNSAAASWAILAGWLVLACTPVAGPRELAVKVSAAPSAMDAWSVGANAPREPSRIERIDVLAARIDDASVRVNIEEHRSDFVGRVRLELALDSDRPPRVTASAWTSENSSGKTWPLTRLEGEATLSATRLPRNEGDAPLRVEYAFTGRQSGSDASVSGAFALTAADLRD